jgi:D-lactate dehydrogenase
MRQDRLQELEKGLVALVGQQQVLTSSEQTKPYTTGIRVGQGMACAVVMPKTLLQLWKTLELCVELDKIIILQAANTGLTGGSTPDGDNYDRDVVIINTLNLDQLILLNGGDQVIAFAGSSLYQLEEKLSPLGRGPHSVIGSSCIGASVVGGICNNSGGNLVNRGPAYTEYSLFAQLNQTGQLELVNHLGIDLGTCPEEILSTLQTSDFNTENLANCERLASDHEYQKRVRDVRSSIPARFNADQRRLREASGCAGKLAVFAVRLDTFPKPKTEKVFYIGTNKPEQLTELRKQILTGFQHLPDMGEYLHRSYFDGADHYCKDAYLAIKYFGTGFIPKLFGIKRNVDRFVSQWPTRLFQDHFSDRTLHCISQMVPDHLPARMRAFRDQYEHHMIILASDQSIQETQNLLEKNWKTGSDHAYFECSESEGKAALLHRYVAGNAPARYQILNQDNSGELLPLDIALPRNCENWHRLLPEEILSQMAESFQMAHFLCMVFHWDFVVKKGVDANELKHKILDLLDQSGAKYPAEHNVGHLYKAETDLSNFYKKIDPTNSFNPGIGKMSKLKNYQ